MKKALSFVCVLMLVAMAVLPVFADSVTYMYVKTDNGKGLNLRTEPCMGDNKVGSIPYGSRVSIVKIVNSNWALVHPDGYMAPYYVQRRYLVKKNPGKYTDTTEVVVNYHFKNFKHVDPYEVTVTTGKGGGVANLRWAPNKGAALMEKLLPGSTVKVIAKTSDWYQVIDESNNYAGFLYYTFIAE